MSFDPQNLLEKSLIQGASDPAHRPQFYKDLVASNLFFIQEGDLLESTSGVVEKDTKIQIQNIELEGRLYIPVFSSLVRLEEVVQREVNYMAMNALDFMKITRGSDLILNPGSDYGKELVKGEIAGLIDGTIWQPSVRYQVKQDTQISIGQPEIYPTELADALARYFKTQKEVKKAYLAHFYNPAQNDPPHTLIGVITTGDWDAVISGAGIISNNVHIPNPPVDFIPLNGSGGVESYFLKECKPFYQRKRFGISKWI